MKNIGWIDDAVVTIKSTVKGDFRVTRHGELIIYGDLMGTLENHGKVIVYGKISGEVINQANASLVVNGVIMGDIKNELAGIIEIHSSGSVSSGKLDNFGTIILQGSIGSACINRPTGVIQNSGALGSITNLGTVN